MHPHDLVHSLSVARGNLWLWCPCASSKTRRRLRHSNVSSLWFDSSIVLQALANPPNVFFFAVCLNTNNHIKHYRWILGNDNKTRTTRGTNINIEIDSCSIGYMNVGFFVVLGFRSFNRKCRTHSHSVKQYISGAMNASKQNPFFLQFGIWF